MDSTDAARHLSSVGKYRAALEALPPEIRRDNSSTLLLRAELLALVGDWAKAAPIVESLQKLKNVSDADKSHLEYVRAFIALEQGLFEEELQHLQKSIFYADRAGDLERTCWAQFLLASQLADRSGPRLGRGVSHKLAK